MLPQDDFDHRCDKCNEIYTDIYNKWCKPCNINFFKNNFTNWTSGNDTIDDFIQYRQLKIYKHNDRIFEWIPYSQFIDVKEIGKDKVSNATIYSALWNDGSLHYNSDKKEWIRNPNIEVALKCLSDPQNIIYEILDEAESYGITQNPDTEDYIIVLQNKYCEAYTKIYSKWCRSCYLKNSFANWTSGNEIIDDFIQNMLLKCVSYREYYYDIIREWIPYSQLIDIKEIGKVENNVATIYSALWNDGPLYYNYDKEEWIRDPSRKVTLKYLNNPQNFIDELFCKEYYGIIYGMSQNPNTKDYIIVLQKYCENCCEEYTDIRYEWCKLCYTNNFTNWTNENKIINNFIQKTQLTATSFKDIIEWIPYTQFISVKEIVKDHDNFNTIYSAIWNNSLYYDYSKYKLVRESQQVTLITLNYLDKSSIIDKLLNKIKDLMIDKMGNVYGITQNPDTKDYIIVCNNIFCEKCNKKYTNIKQEWCKSCHLKDNFTNRISGNEAIDNVIQEMQLKICNYNDIVVEWIPYDQFINIKKIEKVDNNSFTIYAAIWKGGPLVHNNKNIYRRKYYQKVTLKCLSNSQNKINEFLNEAVYDSIKKNFIYGISQNPDTKNYLIVFRDIYCEKCGHVYTNMEYKWCKPCKINYLKNNFPDWTSGNENIDDYIQKMQLKINNYKDSIIEWIPFNQFINIKEMSKIEDNNTTIYTAVCKKNYYKKVVLKCLNNLENKIDEFFNKVENYLNKDNYICVYGISQNLDTKDYIIILNDDIYCKICNEQCLNSKWCKSCQIDFLKNDFNNWTSGNDKINDFIQKMQLKINKYYDIIFEWIPFNQFINIKKIGKVDNNTATVYSAIWKNGPLEYDYYVYKKIYQRNNYREVVLKCLNNSQNKINEFLNKAKSYLIDDNYIYGISQNPDTKDYIMVLQDIYCEKCNEEYTDIKKKWCKICQVNYLKSRFTNWTSESKKINDLIQKMQSKINKCDDIIFEWIPYDQLDYIEKVGKGGFATVYSAIWKNGPLKYDYHKKIYQRNNYKEVALKCLNNSQNISNEFLNEIEIYSINKYNKIMQIYGISQNPDTNNYIMILQYAECGNFNNWMDYYRNFSFCAKFFILHNISVGLREIHQKQLVHRDFHIGNILINSDDDFGSVYYNSIPISTYISDMGLCGEVNNTDKTNIYGVMPYVAPEVLRKRPYTKAADIYSFGMIMYFTITGRQPFENCAHDFKLALDICNGIRPEIPEIPELKSNWYIDLMKKCWDSNSDNRPNIESITTILCERNYTDKEYKEAVHYLNKGYKESRTLSTHPQAIYTSRSKTSMTLTKEMESLSVEKKRKASLSAETQSESKSTKLDENQEYNSEFMEIDSD
ncbi:hypothetical protein RclHR1_00100001 [Rhizophagus clarus]|uniref:Protein kinase domain-containing protein n=1 Tax=Rhizophagus clarus TaxID=94130 RepID=A0A2Z6Q0I7_9GLOM|nr:hypothetical protein RclHR1_00100001 [Rhizophagus clarus]